MAEESHHKPIVDGFDERMSRLLDRELSEDECAALDAQLLNDPALAVPFEQHKRLRSALRESFRAEVAEVNFDGLWERIEAQMDPAAAVKITSQSSAPVIGGGGWAQIRRWIRLSLPEAPLLTPSFAVVTVVAIGFGTFQYLRPTSPSGVDQTSELAANQTPKDVDANHEKIPAPPAIPPSTAADPVIVANAVDTAGVEVNSLAGGDTSTVMVIHSPEDATIIWVHEDLGEGSTSI